MKMGLTPIPNFQHPIAQKKILLMVHLKAKRTVKLMLLLNGENVEAVIMENQPLYEEDTHNIDVIPVNCWLTVRTVSARIIPIQDHTQMITPKRWLPGPVLYVVELDF
jgi:hypothetical protein